ncbi:N-acetyltransferase [Legionella israelensis]|uniref:N-acetyltransferase n=1 Tax=Legionella israelensis TaxID=454 RepID=A0AAX1EFP5_9GAMM|nr:GNAT family N-acetyltransferase [Legionella israelensis]QBR83893.1 N-acetyltransferase [Legionella israelensis]
MKKYLIKTKNLGMRFIQKSDIQLLEDLEKDPEVKKFFPSGTLDRDEIQEMINDCLFECNKRNLPCFAIFELEKGEFVGRAYFDKFKTGETKIGYLFHKKFWDKGYATEVLQALLDWAKQHINADYIIAYADKEHTASFRVMEKCGMEYYRDGSYKGMESKFYRIKNQ